MGKEGEEAILPETTEVKGLELKALAKAVAKTGLPFGISTAAAGNTVLISLLLAEIGPSAVAAGPFIAALQNFAIGICRAALLSNNLAIGGINGKAVNEEDYLEIGKTLRQGWILAAILAGGSSLVLGFSGPILDGIGIDSAIAAEVGSYFKYYIIGSFPLLHSFADQQLAVGTQNPWLPALRGPIYGAAVYALSYLAVNGHFGEEFKGVNGIGLGSAAAAWLIFLLTKAAHLLPGMRKYGLYTWDFEGGIEIFKKLVSMSAKLGFQVATEWINLLGMSIIIGHMGIDSVHAMQPAIQMLTMSGLFSLGFSAGVGALCVNSMGKLHAAIGGPGESEANKNLVKLGYSGIAGGMVVPAGLSLIMFSVPRLITSNLLPSSTSDDLLDTADMAVRINALGLLLDAFRINAAGPLRAFKDINFVTFFSFLMMSVFGLPAEAGACIGEGEGVDVFSWLRDATILLPAIFIFIRWMTAANSAPPEKIQIESLHMKQGGSCAALFRPVKTVKDNGGELTQLLVQTDVQAQANRPGFGQGS